jgi:hypothetical protein
VFERVLEPGVRIVLDERVKTDLSGRLQVLFLDGTALTLGSDSDVVIDKFFYDPNSGEGNLVVNATSGLFRVIGGKISKKNAIKFNTPTSTIMIRGGMGDIRVTNNGVSAYFHYGDSMSVTSNGKSEVISRPGYTITTTPEGIPSEPQPAAQEDLEALTEQLKVGLRRYPFWSGSYRITWSGYHLAFSIGCNRHRIAVMKIGRHPIISYPYISHTATDHDR